MLNANMTESVVVAVTVSAKAGSTTLGMTLTLNGMIIAVCKMMYIVTSHTFFRHLTTKIF